MSATRTFTCPGLTMPQPTDAPFEGYVACYRAGHECTCVNETIEDERGRTSSNFCPCCGNWYVSLYVPREMLDEGGW